MYPSWLPTPISLNGSSINQDYSTLHELFNSEILGKNLEVDGIKVIVNTDPDKEMPQYEGGFMHLITRKDSSGLRIIDYARANKLHWVPAIINNYLKPEVRSFWCTSPKGETLYLWLHGHNHMVVLKWTSRAQARKVIVTAFCVDSYNQRYYESLYTQATKILS